MTYYIFKISTDLRYGCLEMQKTASKKIAESYLQKGSEFTFPERATNRIRGIDQNFHRNLYDVYEFNGRLPLKEIKKKYEIAAEYYRHSVYSKSYSLEQYILEHVAKFGLRLKAIN